MKPKWWWVPVGLVSIVAIQVWGFEMQQSPIQQLIPGYVMKVALYVDSTATTTATSWSAPVPPDSVLVTLYRQTAIMEGDSLIEGLDSTVVVYRPVYCHGR